MQSSTAINTTGDGGVQVDRQVSKEWPTENKESSPTPAGLWEFNTL